MPGLTQYLIENPLYSFGQSVAKQGADTSPVLSPMQGLARALQGGVGGFFEGQGLKQSKADQAGDNVALADAMKHYATDPQAAMAMIAKRPQLGEFAQGLMAQQAALQQKLVYEQALGASGADRINQAFGRPPAAGAPAQGAAPGAPAAPAAPPFAPDLAGRIAALGAEYQQQYGRPLPVTSGTRTADEQTRLYNNRGNNPYPVAPPGTSNHETGRAFDLAPDVADALDRNGTLARHGLHRPHAHDPVHIEAIPVQSGSPAGNGDQSAAHPQGWNEQLWRQLEPLVRSRSITPEKAAEMLQADALSRRSLDQTQAHTMQTERFRAGQQQGPHTVAMQDALERDDNFKNTLRARPIMNSIYRYANDSTPVSSVALVNSVAQILEPGSVDRDGRLQMSEAGGWREKIHAALDEARTGQLSPEKRRELVAIAQTRYQEMHAQAHERGLRARRTAQGVGLNPDLVYDPASIAPPAAPPTPPVTVPAQPGAPAAPMAGAQPASPVQAGPAAPAPAPALQRGRDGRLVVPGRSR